MKAAIHVHSNWSYDGSWTLEDIAREFRRRGYAAVLMAEHDRGFDEDRWGAYREACREASVRGALLVPGIEYSDRANHLHIAVWGVHPFLGEARETVQLLTDAAEEGGAAVLAHPGRRNAWKALDEIEISRLAGVEVWNRKYDGWAPGRAGVGMAERHRDLVPFFGLDFHTARQFHPIGMSFDIEDDAAADAIVDALLAHRCGPVAFGVEGKRLMSGPAYALSRSAESSRRAIRPAVRRWRRFRGSTTG